MQDLETSLAGALASVPLRRNAAQSVGAQVGLEAGLHARRGRRQSFAEADGTTSAAALVSRLPEAGESLHLLMDGTFTAALIIPTIQRLIGEPCRLTICTLGLNDRTTDLLAGMLKDGRLAHLRLAMSSLFRAGDPEIAARATSTFRELGAEIAVERLHARLQLWQPATAQDRFIFETSSNLRSLNCIETATLTNDGGLFAWHDRWLSKFFDAPIHHQR